MEPAPLPAAPAPAGFAYPSWLLAAIVVAVMMIPIAIEAKAIHSLRQQLALERARVLPPPDPLQLLRLVSLAPRDPRTTGVVTVAWNVQSHRGFVIAQDLAAAPAGAGYCLWVLDPTATAPIPAGALTVDRLSHPFAAPSSLGTATPGFVVTQESSATPTVPSVPILFAVAPGE